MIGSLAIACGEAASTDELDAEVTEAAETSDQTDPVEVGAMKDAIIKFSVQGLADLPECNEKNERSAHYVIEDSLLYFCQDSIWNPINSAMGSYKIATSFETLQPGDAMCADGGSLLKIWTEGGEADGTYDAGVDKDLKQTYVCNGANGADGSDGVDGVDGSDGADGVAGANGADGADGAAGANGADGADGAAGANGADGANSVLLVTNVSADTDVNDLTGESNPYQCASVTGYTLEAFTDVNGNGTYDSGTDTNYTKRLHCSNGSDPQEQTGGS